MFYLGKKYNEEKKEIFLNADFFVFPTFYHNETFGLVNLEAMMYGLPIVSTNEGGIPDIVKNNFNGFVVPSKNPTELARQMVALINDKELRIKLGENGREKFLNEYTLDKFEKNLVQIISEIL